MSVSLLEVIEHGGYDPLNDLSDGKWLLSKQSEFEELIERVENYIEEYENDNDNSR